MNSLDLKKELKKLSSEKKAKASAWFFKTGLGQYGEGDLFIGVTVPEQRKIAKVFKDLPLAEVEKLLKSPIHEERLVSLLILNGQFAKGNKTIKKEIYKFYLANTQFVNNWDLVDSSASYIVGTYLLDKPREILYKLAKSPSLWERRISIISTLAFIVKGESSDTLKIAEVLLNDKEDLMHKAVGWMLREVGKRVSREELVSFLNKHYKNMPRTALRYAIEHFPEAERQKYLKGKA
ncbi:MAG TPA: DNA alkylation repair protein [Candidatus Saccharimonadales bacterium]|nr:DNA alkylation repair protein [Candidatus Saccharimonadales bacterium]